MIVGILSLVLGIAFIWIAFANIDEIMMDDINECTKNALNENTTETFNTIDDLLIDLEGKHND